MSLHSVASLMILLLNRYTMIFVGQPTERVCSHAEQVLPVPTTLRAERHGSALPARAWVPAITAEMTVHRSRPYGGLDTYSGELRKDP